MVVANDVERAILLLQRLFIVTKASVEKSQQIIAERPRKSLDAAEVQHAKATVFAE